MTNALECILAPPLVARRYTCGTSCMAPVTILCIACWAFVLMGLLGGPLNQLGINWPTVFFGLLLWLISGIWTWLVTRNKDQCQIEKHDDS